MSYKKARTAVYNGRSWQYRTKELSADGKTVYRLRKGFATEEEAMASKQRSDEEYTKAYKDYYGTVDKHNDMTFIEFLIYWLESIISPRVETTTMMIIDYAIYELIIPSIDQDVKLTSVTTEYLDSLLKRASEITESAGNKSREVIYLCLRDAVRQKLISRNPAENTVRYPRKKSNVRIYNKETLRLFLAKAKEVHWYLEILLACFCGLRKGEIMGLKFSDIDEDNRTIHIQRQITSNPQVKKGGGVESYPVAEKKTKTPNSDRILHLPDVVWNEIMKRKAEVDGYKERMGAGYNDNGYISCRNDGYPHSMSAMNIALTKICRANGLAPITVHGLRHQYATILAEQGVSLPRISALLGHASVVTTFEYYIGLMDEQDRILDYINTSFSGGIMDD